MHLRPGAGPSPGLDTLIQADHFELLAIRGPQSAFIRAAPEAEAVAILLEGTARERAGPVEAGDAVVLGPGGALTLEISEGSTALVAAASGVEVFAGAGCPRQEPLYRVERREVLSAMEPRGKVKIVEGELWKPAASPGSWRPGTEILGRAMALSYFRGGAPERPHCHLRSWEAYCVLEGRLVVEQGDGAQRHRQEAGPAEVIALPPGRHHLVDESSRHVTVVVQFSPGSFGSVESAPSD